jgi:hypothetical protein
MDDAPMPTGWRSTYLVVTWDLVREMKERRRKPTSKEVPKMLSLTKDMDTRWFRGEGIGVGNPAGSSTIFHSLHPQPK